MLAAPSARRTLAVSRKVFQGLRRDPRSLALILVAPILAMVVFGLVFGTPMEHLPVVVVDEDEGPFAGEVVARLDRDTLDLSFERDLANAKGLVERGEAYGVIHFPRNFTAGTTAHPPSPPSGAGLDLLVDATNPNTAGTIAATLQSALRDALQAKGGKDPVSVTRVDLYGEGLAYIDYFVPGIMAFAAFMVTALLTLLAFVGERTSGTLDRLLVSPLLASEIVLGYAIAFGVLGAVQGILLLTVAVYGFGVQVAGSFALACVVVILAAVASMSLGILLSAAAKNETQAVQFLPLLIFPTFLLAGIFLPTEAIPAWLQPVSLAIPTTWAVMGLRDVMLRGHGVTEVWDALLALVLFATAFLTLAGVGLSRLRARPAPRAP